MPYKRKYIIKGKTLYKKKYKKTSLKKALLKMHEVKEVCFQDFLHDMTHQTYYQFSPTQQILPGNTGTTRVGDEVFLTSLQMSGFFQVAHTAFACCKFRLTVFWSTSEVACPATATNQLIGSAIWHPGTDAIVANAISNPNAVTVLADFIVDSSQLIDGGTEFKSFNLEVPLNKTFKYRLPGSAYGKTKNLYVSLNGFIDGGSNGDDLVGQFSLASVLKFKDP